jgi:hypothetical protein
MPAFQRIFFMQRTSRFCVGFPGFRLSPPLPNGNGYAAPPIPAVLAIAHKIYSRGWFNTPMLCV